jgi:hypothetical protein
MLHFHLFQFLYNIFCLFIYLYILHDIIPIIIMCNFKQLSKYQVKYMNVYIEPLIDELLKLWVGITMYVICKPIGEKKFKFRGILLWTIYDAPGLTHFCGM